MKKEYLNHEQIISEWGYRASVIKVVRIMTGFYVETFVDANDGAVYDAFIQDDEIIDILVQKY